ADVLDRKTIRYLFHVAEPAAHGFPRDQRAIRAGKSAERSFQIEKGVAGGCHDIPLCGNDIRCSRMQSYDASYGEVSMSETRRSNADARKPRYEACDERVIELVE